MQLSEEELLWAGAQNRVEPCLKCMPGKKPPAELERDGCPQWHHVNKILCSLERSPQKEIIHGKGNYQLNAKHATWPVRKMERYLHFKKKQLVVVDSQRRVPDQDTGKSVNTERRRDLLLN